MKKYFLAITAVAIVGTIALSTGCSFDNEEEYYGNMNCDTSSVTYSATIAPILNQSCTSCHSMAGGTLPFYDNYNDIKDYLDMADDSNLIQRINFVGPNAPMPEGGPKMPDCDILKIERWIADGYPNN